MFFFEPIAAHPASPHLILHFDINRTLIALDKGQKKSPQDIIINTLADQIEFLWDDTLPFPIPYSNYIKYHLIPNPTRSPTIKEEQKEAICHFLDYLKENHHPLYSSVLERFDQAMLHLQEQKNLIFSSFYNMIDYLNEKNISYTLVFRTFGQDLPDIADELNRHYGDQFLRECTVYTDRTPESFYYYLKNLDHHIGIRDNWNLWYAHEEQAKYGKSFPIDLSDPNALSLFFDDNARLDKEHPEWNAVSPIDLHIGPLTPANSISKKILIPVDMLQALSTPHYFISLLEERMERWGK